MGRDFNARKGARFYHPPSGYFDTRGHAKWDPESLYHSKLTQSSRIASVVGEGSVEDFEYLVGTTLFDDEDGLLYVTTKVFEGSIPDGPCILGERSPILANGVVSARHSTVSVHVRNIVLMIIRAQESESTAVERGSDVENVLEADRASNGLSSISKSDSSTSSCPGFPSDVWC